MRCPKCNYEYTVVVDSRRHLGEGKNNFIRRRRECDECRYRFTTYERIDMDDVKESQRRPLHEILKVKFEKDGVQIRADARALPGTPPVGRGNTRAEALYDLFAKIIWEWDTWGKYMLAIVKKEKGNW